MEPWHCQAGNDLGWRFAMVSEDWQPVEKLDGLRAATSRPRFVWCPSPPGEVENTTKAFFNGMLARKNCRRAKQVLRRTPMVGQPTGLNKGVGLAVER